ncbi:hypothetical protein HK098_002121 [Nowakowskiella sp. JEL0407]|nr:hypothetical protein HK098_002121 [Nowakowskiella sp. JEL0407]
MTIQLNLLLYLIEPSFRFYTTSTSIEFVLFADHDDKRQFYTPKSEYRKVRRHAQLLQEVFRIRDALRARAFSVWIDVEQINGDIYEAMRDAIVSSKVVVSCLTQKYESSDNCKRELYFTAGLRNPSKHIVPIRLDNGPFTWSEFVTAGLLYMGFSNTSASEWDSKFESLA